MGNFDINTIISGIGVILVSWLLTGQKDIKEKVYESIAQLKVFNEWKKNFEDLQEEKHRGLHGRVGRVEDRVNTIEKVVK